MAYHSSKQQMWPPLSYQPLQHARAHTDTNTQSAVRETQNGGKKQDPGPRHKMPI